MSSRYENVRMYWLHAVAIVLFLLALAPYLRIGHWEALIVPMASACFGLACTLAAEEVSDWTGWYTWSQENYWTYLPRWIRAFDILLLVAVNLFGFRSGE